MKNYQEMFPEQMANSWQSYYFLKKQSKYLRRTCSALIVPLGSASAHIQHFHNTSATLVGENGNQTTQVSRLDGPNEDLSPSGHTTEGSINKSEGSSQLEPHLKWNRSNNNNDSDDDFNNSNKKDCNDNDGDDDDNDSGVETSPLELERQL